VEHNDSACPLFADMKADIDFCRSGPGADVEGLSVSPARITKQLPVKVPYAPLCAGGTTSTAATPRLVAQLSCKKLRYHFIITGRAALR
jgi:hypothetical protein